MEGKTSKLGSLNYKPFKDVQKKLNDEIYKIEQLSKEQTIEYRDGQGNIQVIKKQMLTPDQVRQIAMSNLDADDLKQIEINGWTNSGGYTNPELISTTKNFIKEKAEYNNIKAQSLQAILDKGGLDDETKENYKNQITAYKNNSKELENYANNMNDKKQAATYLEKERTVENAVKTFGGLYVESITWKKDDAFWEKQNYDLKRAEFEYKIEKDKQEESKKNPTSDVLVSNIPLTENEMPDIDSIETKVDEEINKYKGVYDTTLAEYKTQIETLAKQGNKEAKAVMDLYKQNLKTKEDQDAFYLAIKSQIQTNSGLRILENRDGVPTNYMSIIDDNFNKYKKLTTAKVEATKEAKTEHINATLNNDETFSAFYNNPNTKMMWRTPQGKETAIPVYKVLQANGLMDSKGKKIGDITDEKYKSVLKALEKSYYADIVITKMNSAIHGFPKDSLQYIKKLANSLGENGTDIIQKREYDMGNRGLQTFYELKRGSKTLDFITSARANGIYDSFSWSDQSLSSDDATIGRFIKADYRDNEKYKNKLKSLYGNLPSNKSIGIVREDKGNFNRVLSIAKSASSENPFAINSDRNTINMRLDGDYVVLSQTEGSDEKMQTKETRVPKNDFIKNAPDLASKLDFETESSFYQLGRVDNSDLVSEPIKFYTKETPSKMFKYGAKVVLKNNLNNAVYLRNEDAIKDISDSYPEYTNVVEKLINNSSKFSINGEVNKDFDGSSYLTLYLRNNNGDVVDKRDFENIKDVDNFKTIIDEVPQVYYGMFVKKIIGEQKLSKITKEADSSTYTKLISSLN